MGWMSEFPDYRDHRSFGPVNTVDSEGCVIGEMDCRAVEKLVELKTRWRISLGKDGLRAGRFFAARL